MMDIVPTAFISFLAVPALFLVSHFGIKLPDAPPPDPAADEARFNAVNSQLDTGGTVYGYISVDGDLTAVGEFVSGISRQIQENAPKGGKLPVLVQVDVPKILDISGLDSVSAIGFSSKRAEVGFRNKAYIHAPEGRTGLLRAFGDTPQPFEVVKMAPAWTDIAISQTLNLKQVYDTVQEAAGVIMGEQGAAMMKAMAQRPAGPFPFTLEQVLADLDTKVTFILDADSAMQVGIPGVQGLSIPQMEAAILVDGLGCVADKMITTVEKKLQENEGRPAPVNILRSQDWVGMRLSVPPGQGRNVAGWLGILSAISDSKPALLHHVPSGNLVVTTGQRFAQSLFSQKPGLSTDPDFQKATAGLPTEGTGLSYISPAFFGMVRSTMEGLSTNKKVGKKEGMIFKTAMDLIVPQGAQGEASVTTSTGDGILVVSNSAHSHKARLASPLFTSVLPMMYSQTMKVRQKAMDRQMKLEMEMRERVLREEQEALESAREEDAREERE